MPLWTPAAEWTGADAIIIGGGPSLKEFKWTALEGRRTLGCNAAFRLGVGVCSLNFFADKAFFDHNEDDLCAYAGPVVSNAEEFERHPWVRYMPRRDYGLHTDALGLGGNSGCAAINLALVLGAARVFLIGFDCKLGSTAEMNWHEHRYEPANAEVFPKFQEGFYHAAQDLPRVFPGRQVINCTPGSALAAFPMGKLEDYL